MNINLDGNTLVNGYFAGIVEGATGGVQTFADETAREAATPDAIGQLGIQLDTLQIYAGTALTAGSWTAAPQALTPADSPTFAGLTLPDPGGVNEPVTLVNSDSGQLLITSNSALGNVLELTSLYYPEAGTLLISPTQINTSDSTEGSMDLNPASTDNVTLCRGGGDVHWASGDAGTLDQNGGINNTNGSNTYAIAGDTGSAFFAGDLTVGGTISSPGGEGMAINVENGQIAPAGYDKVVDFTADELWDGGGNYMANWGLGQLLQSPGMGEVLNWMATTLTGPWTLNGAPVGSYLDTPPSTATSAGIKGQYSFDSTHIYMCIATNTWVRAAAATW